MRNRLYVFRWWRKGELERLKTVLYQFYSSFLPDSWYPEYRLWNLFRFEEIKHINTLTGEEKIYLRIYKPLEIVWDMRSESYERFEIPVWLLYIPKGTIVKVKNGIIGV
jgi:hypothetical protein